jgi:hypothetical protein
MRFGGCGRVWSYAVAVAGLAVAIAAEAATYLPEEPALAAGDALVGLAFIGLGLVAWQLRPSSRSGLLMVATGFAWFAGSFAGAGRVGESGVARPRAE